LPGSIGKGAGNGGSAPAENIVSDQGRTANGRRGPPHRSVLASPYGLFQPVRGEHADRHLNGRYLCEQGETGLRLTINANADGKLTATFSFFAVPSNPGVPSGDFTMTGSFTASGENFTMGHWIHQPTGYEMVNLSAGPPTNGGTVLNGNVSYVGCSTFSVKKA
jgi:hypothetical protein